MTLDARARGGRERTVCKTVRSSVAWMAGKAQPAGRGALESVTLIDGMSERADGGGGG